MTIEEEWRPVVSYDGYFSDSHQVSNWGRVKSLARKTWIVRKGKGFWRTVPEKILKPQKTGKYGHLQVQLSKDGNVKEPLVHQLVAQAFLEPVPGKDYVDHIDGNPENNVVTNLRYCTLPENNGFQLARENKSKGQNRPEVKEKKSKATKLRWESQEYRERLSKALKNANNRPEVKEKRSKALTNHQNLSKPILQYTKSGEFVAEYPSAMEAQRQTGFRQGNISACCRGVLKSAYGFIWKYKEKEEAA